MEEKNQDTQDTNQYTGEYGNPMEKSEDTVKPAGEEQSSSVYSYSYRDHKPELPVPETIMPVKMRHRQVQRKAPPVRRHSRRKHQVMPMQRHRKRIVMAGPLWGTSR
ncbi:hypothetical protein DXB96_04505 [Clostridium sp. OM07-10AC]|nr:hypothetical protein DXC08_11515 [Clostridium sp. OM07-9AC]RHV06488.1 hypothetical protein DXB96_04505 [Clostridium sp. OM07-10AC]